MVLTMICFRIFIDSDSDTKPTFVPCYVRKFDDVFYRFSYEPDRQLFSCEESFPLNSRFNLKSNVRFSGPDSLTYVVI